MIRWRGLRKIAWTPLLIRIQLQGKKTSLINFRMEDFRLQFVISFDSDQIVQMIN